MALRDNLVSYWDLDEASGVRYDAHAGNDLQDFNTVLSASDGGITVADFESSQSEYLQIAEASQTGLDGMTALSISFWMKAESTGTGAYPVIVSKWSETGNQRSYAVAYFSNKIYFYVSSDGANLSQVSTATISVGTWYHIVGTFESGTDNLKIYLNAGTPVTGTPIPTSIYNGTAQFTVGRPAGPFAGTTSYYDGLMKRVGIWNRVLSSSEVTELYNSGAGLDYAGTAEAPAGTTVNASRDAETHGSITVNDARSSEIHGQDVTNDERGGEIHGVVGANTTRAAQIEGTTAVWQIQRNKDSEGWVDIEASIVIDESGGVHAYIDDSTLVEGSVYCYRVRNLADDSPWSNIDCVDYSLGVDTHDERGAEIHGSTTATDERGAEVHGSVLVSDSRSAEVTGSQAVTDERASEVHGADSTEDSRQAEITGSQNTDNERGAETTGVEGGTDVRSAEVHGTDITDDTRSGEIEGSLGMSASRASEISGVDATADTRGAEIEGGDENTDIRRVEIIGMEDTHDERGSEVIGVDSTASERGTEVHGQAYGNSERDAEVFGSQGDTDERTVEIHGVSTGSEERGVEIHGEAATHDERLGEITGSIETSDERSSTIWGIRIGDDVRAAQIEGYIPQIGIQMGVNKNTGVTLGTKFDEVGLNKNTGTKMGESLLATRH